MLNNILNESECNMLRSLINDAETIVICCHMNPDGDALGSSLGWAEYLRSIGKDPVVIVPDQYPDYLQWLPNSEKIIRYDKHTEQAELLLKTADLICCLDFNTPSRTDQMAETLVSAAAKKLLIDHHLGPDIETELTVSHPEASSTSELVFRLVWQLGGFESQSRHFAIPIYCGMMTDTGGFTYNSSDPDIYFIISQLLTKKINKDKIYRNVYHNYSENRLRLLGYVMLEKLVVDASRHASYFTLTRQDLRRFHFIKGDAEGLVNMPLQIKGHKLSVSLREDTEKDNLVWVSLRSVDNFPCNKIAAQFFNGGGHLNASGGRVNGTMEDAVKTVQDALQAYEDLLK
jgi:phosphoesterase RecJ-like protein